MNSTLTEDKVWISKRKYDEAERRYYEKLAGRKSTAPSPDKIWVQKFKYDEAEKKYYEKLTKLQKQKEDHVMSKGKPNEALINGIKKPPVTDSIKLAPCSMRRLPNSTAVPIQEKIWLKKSRYDEAEKSYYEKLAKGISTNAVNKNSLAGEVAKARQHIKSSLECIDDIAAIAASNANVDINNRLNVLEKEKASLKQQVTQLTALVKRLELRVSVLEKKDSTPSSSVTQNATPKPATTKPAPPRPAPVPADDEDDGVDLFGSDSEEEDPEAQKVMEKRLAEYAAKKSKKPVLIAKSNIILDVKPWDDETDMKVMEAEVRKITKDGLVWGASKLVPLAYGIHKLQISCVVEDEKVSVDWLEESIQEITDYVQSVDIAAFNKV